MQKNDLKKQIKINLNFFSTHFGWFIKPYTAVSIKSKINSTRSFKWASWRQFLLLERRSFKVLKAPPPHSPWTS